MTLILLMLEYGEITGPAKFYMSNAQTEKGSVDLDHVLQECKKLCESLLWSFGFCFSPHSKAPLKF